MARILPAPGNQITIKLGIPYRVRPEGPWYYLCGRDREFGTVMTMSIARALRFATESEAEAACNWARSVVPTFVDGREIEYRVIPV